MLKYLLTSVLLTPGGSSTVNIYTENNTTNNTVNNTFSNFQLHPGRCEYEVIAVLIADAVSNSVLV
jgi:hypothetical protein